MGFVLDTSDVELWRAGAAEAFFPMNITPTTSRPFRARLAVHELGPVAIGRVTAEPNRCVRTSREIALGDPELLRVLVLRRGLTRVQQDDRACVVTGGDVVLYDSSRPFAVDADACDLVVCGLPLALFGAHADRLRALTATRIPATASVAKLFAGFVIGLADELDAGTVGDVASELAETLVAFSRALAQGEAPVSATSRARRVQAWIDAHVSEEGLTPARIAAAHHLSVRSLHRLFAAEGTSVSAWLRARRLEGCRRDLADPALADRTVAEIARAWGFDDPARFSRRFREVYGRPPSASRR